MDDFSIKHNYFDKAIRARFIKFHTIEWSKHPSMRVEIIGCQGSVTNSIYLQIKQHIYFCFVFSRM